MNLAQSINEGGQRKARELGKRDHFDSYTQVLATLQQDAAAVSTPGWQAVADAGGSPWPPCRASRGAVTFELTASQLLSAVVNVAQNKWQWGELGPEGDEFAIAWSGRSAETHNRNGQAPPRFFEEVFELIIEANRYRLSYGRRSRNLPSRREPELVMKGSGPGTKDRSPRLSVRSPSSQIASGWKALASGSRDLVRRL